MSFSATSAAKLLMATIHIKEIKQFDQNMTVTAAASIMATNALSVSTLIIPLSFS
jgi:hypothetical protein